MTDFHLHLVSDATGDTIKSVARACTVLFEGVVPKEHFWNMVRTRRQLDMVLEDVAQHRGMVVYTLVDDDLRRHLEDQCDGLGVPCISVLDPIIAAMSEHLRRPVLKRPGRQHALDDAYFQRMEAMDFALRHDDGQLLSEVHRADVILVGVSRTSKTPTCLYLANRGLKVANVPFVPGLPIPLELENLNKPLVVGLTKEPDRLVQLRRNRLVSLQQDPTAYIDPEMVREEVTAARRLYSQRGWPVIDVTRRAIEETAAEIMKLLQRHQAERAKAHG